ncbi:hypothetical protein SAMN05421858_2321 [Haladaptatus litoreus]|uniref:Uncharacterized protein n=1 Tax=Haladaptatus litoreus TaxID=553468 RepID=A0A1N7B3U8_9EURY|nr:hypothetical protein [Haladaptatus litoreus]SIR46050.1 hypothetical protein SAMN05421858_2321 [Haladaptatus litoreus]
MKRRELLACGSGVLSVGFAGCLGSLRPADDEAEQTTDITADSTTTFSTTATEPGTEAFRILNDDSTSYEIDLTVSRVGDERNPVIDATYEVPSKYLLYFWPFLEHGQEYYLKAVLKQGTTLEKTVTNDGCVNDQYNPEGEKPLVLSIRDGELDTLFWECDVVYPTAEYTGSMADQHEVSNSTTETTVTTTTSTF